MDDFKSKLHAISKNIAPKKNNIIVSDEHQKIEILNHDNLADNKFIDNLFKQTQLNINVAKSLIMMPDDENSWEYTEASKDELIEHIIEVCEAQGTETMPTFFYNLSAVHTDTILSHKYKRIVDSIKEEIDTAIELADEKWLIWEKLAFKKGFIYAFFKNGILFLLTPFGIRNTVGKYIECLKVDLPPDAFNLSFLKANWFKLIMLSSSKKKYTIESLQDLKDIYWNKHEHIKIFYITS